MDATGAKGVLTFGSLFSGAGMMDLGIEAAGVRCRWQVEIDDYATGVLARHWPTVPRYRDVHEFPPPVSRLDGLRVDLIAGGFPCPPVSCAGKRRGTADPRWLWPEMVRVVRLLRPRWVLAENVRGLLSAGNGSVFAGVLRDLADSGYRVGWTLLRASDFGYPHRRERVFIVGRLADGAGGGLGIVREPSGGAGLADGGGGEAIPFAPPGPGDLDAWRAVLERWPWLAPALEPGFRRVADGRSVRMDRDRRQRLKCLGNGVVPACAWYVASLIAEADHGARGEQA